LPEPVTFCDCIEVFIKIRIKGLFTSEIFSPPDTAESLILILFQVYNCCQGHVVFSNKQAVEINKKKIDGLLSCHPEKALLSDLGVNLRGSLCGIHSKVREMKMDGFVKSQATGRF
jgi:hypothetical protein